MYIDKYIHMYWILPQRRLKDGMVTVSVREEAHANLKHVFICMYVCTYYTVLGIFLSLFLFLPIGDAW